VDLVFFPQQQKKEIIIPFLDAARIELDVLRQYLHTSHLEKEKIERKATKTKREKNLGLDDIVDGLNPFALKSVQMERGEQQQTTTTSKTI